MAVNRLIARIARQGGGKLLDMAVDRLFGGKQPEAAAETETPPAQPAPKPASSITGKAANAALAQIARRSVPAAIVIGAGVLAKHLYDKRRAKKNGGGDA